MSKYLVTSKHEPAECLRALDEMLTKGPDILDAFFYGCKDGDHTGYAIVDAMTVGEALSLLPDSLKNTARVSKVGKFTADEVRALHTKAA